MAPMNMHAELVRARRIAASSYNPFIVSELTCYADELERRLALAEDESRPPVEPERLASAA